jgi:hypothetical protein
METVLPIIAIIFVQIGVGRILQRKEEYEVELEFAETEKRDAVFWGLSPDSYNEQIIEIQKRGYGSLFERFKFGLVTGRCRVGAMGGRLARGPRPELGSLAGVGFRCDLDIRRLSLLPSNEEVRPRGEGYCFG